MPYAPQTWVDGTTPLDAAHMNFIETGLVSMVDTDNVVAAASQLVANKLLAGDAQPSFRILGDGSHAWGPGGATAPDTTLYRNSASQLKTDGALQVGGQVQGVDNIAAKLGSAALVWIGSQGPSGAAGMVLGSASDTNLYRAAAGELRTDSYLESTKRIYASIGVANQMEMGDLTYGAGLRFGSAIDTNLWRVSAGTLRTDGVLQSVGQFAAKQGTTSVIWMGDVGPSGASGFTFGNAADANLYRKAAGVLQTDNTLVVQGGTDHYVPMGPQARNTIEAWLASASLISIGETADANANPALTLYRTSAGGASGDSARIAHLYGRGHIFQYGSDAAYGSETFTTRLEIDPSGRLLFGVEGSQDTNLYRSAAGRLGTDGSFDTKAEARINMNGSGGVDEVRIGYPGLNFGTYPGDTTLQRIGANYLQTGGSFDVLGNLRTRQNVIGFGNGSTYTNNLIMGSGVPSIGIGSTGDFYLRTDTPSTANQRLYVKQGASSWLAIL